MFENTYPLIYKTLYVARRFASVIGRKSKKTQKLRVTGLFEGNSPVTDEFRHKGH